MAAEVVIDSRFRGPPDSANGGYACGVLVADLEPAPAVEATLRAPPPLDHPLKIEVEDGDARMLDGEALVAEGHVANEPELEIPEPVSIEDAEAARSASPMQHEHPYPGCFVCGSERGPGDGLQVTCGPVEGRELVAAPFRGDPSIAASDGSVRPEFVWSVLDCPSGIAAMLVPGYGISVLGRMTAQILHPLDASESYVAVGWPIERDGRKLFAGTAILDSSGEPQAIARATWIEVGEPPPAG